VPTLRLEPVPFDEAIAAAIRRLVVLPDVFYGDLQGQARAKAFTVSGLNALDQLQAVWDSLRAVLSEGGTFEQWREQIQSVDLPSHRLETVYRTNLQAAWSQGRAEQIRRNLRTHPYLMYSAVNDSRTRPDHAARHGTILPADHPWWRANYPPLGFNCRCRAIAVTRKEAERRGISAEPPGVPVDPDWGPRSLFGDDDMRAIESAIARRMGGAVARKAAPAAIQALTDAIRRWQTFNPRP
jgi:SPP1 gp7 family putative phage head morphogenesis protein